MRRLFRCGAAVALIAILIVPAVYADDPPNPTDPPSVRGIPPIGTTAQSDRSTFFELFWLWLAVRGAPPIG